MADPVKGKLAALLLTCGVLASGVATTLGLFGALPEPAFAVDAKLQGTTFFKAKKYKQAAAAYKIAMAQNPKDAAIAYYYALSLQYSNDIKGAKVAYLDIVSKFPQSSSASYASAALQSLDPTIFQGATSQQLQTFSGSRQSSGYSGSSGGASNGDVIPTSSVVNFDKENDHMVVPVSLNGHTTKFIFDTGAEMILIGKNTLRDLGMPMPTGDTIARSRGASGKIEEVWGQRMAVTCGGVTRNVMVHIAEHIDHMPLLGLPFVNGLNYSIDSGSIRFSAKPSSSGSSLSRGSVYGSSDPRAVKFEMIGRSIIVTANINGRNVPMVWDTGAGQTLFSAAQAEKAGIRIPENAEVMIGSGAGGTFQGMFVPDVSIRLGPAEKRYMKVGINPVGSLPYPLLGRDFWGDMHYTFDNDAKVIRFN